MIVTRLFKYIKLLIENEDYYALDVLYFCFRDTFEKNNFSLNGIKDILISEVFHPETVQIKLSDDYELQQKTIALLLSLRAIILNHELFAYCETDELIFKSSCFKPFQWVTLSSILLDFQKDEDFYSLFCMLKTVENDGKITNLFKEKFHKNTIVPPYKNLDNLYKQMSNSERENTGQVIINNAYLGDDSLVIFKIPESVEYIGNTAISYCKNLQEIVFMRDDVKFGVFPIIECSQLKGIIVPEGSEEYYMEQLPFYKDIIHSGIAHDTIVSFEEFKEEDKRIEEKDEPIQGVIEDTAIYLSEDDNDPALTKLNDEFKKLEDIFKNKTTTYKFFWFLAILELIKEKKAMYLTYQEILTRMVVLAWELYINHVDFGPKDSLPSIIRSLATELDINLYTAAGRVEKLIEKKYSQKKIYKILSVLIKNVPYRFLSPWVKYTTDEEVKTMSQSFDCDAPYALYDDSIILDEAWYDYLIDNYDKLHAFARKSLAKYLKSYNSELVLLGLMVENKE